MASQPMLSTARLQLLPPEAPWARAVRDYQLRNRAHLAPWEPTRGDMYFTELFWGPNDWHILLKIVVVGCSWALISHALSGLRHFVLDTGAGLAKEQDSQERRDRRQSPWGCVLHGNALCVPGHSRVDPHNFHHFGCRRKRRPGHHRNWYCTNPRLELAEGPVRRRKSPPNK